MCDLEFNKSGFKNYCDEIQATIIPKPAHLDQSNGAVERKNCTLRSYFLRLRACDPISSVADKCFEEEHGKP